MLRNIFDRIRTAFSAFMAGRYGRDELGIFLIAAAVVLDLIFVFTGFLPLYIAGFALILYALFRMLSRKVSRRKEENRKFLDFLAGLKMRKTHHIYRCPECGQKIRVPRKGGQKVEIRCPRCGGTFVKTI
ncbi:MAG: hypothetical protein J6Z23_07275 [Lachnospiraceae bacterium]|nr:hypothetical protein [Lachnospiraceae bacterium]